MRDRPARAVKLQRAAGATARCLGAALARLRAALVDAGEQDAPIAPDWPADSKFNGVYRVRHCLVRPGEPFFCTPVSCETRSGCLIHSGCCLACRSALTTAPTKRTAARVGRTAISEAVRFHR